MLQIQSVTWFRINDYVYKIDKTKANKSEQVLYATNPIYVQVSDKQD